MRFSKSKNHDTRAIEGTDDVEGHMMGHQVNFWATPADTGLIERALRSRGPLALLHGRCASHRPCLVESFDVDEDGKPWLYFNLARLEDLSQVVMLPVPAQGYWTADVARSPVVEFSRSFFNGQILRRGRVYYVDGYFRADGTWVEKSEGFRRWARLLLSAIRRPLTRRGMAYIGPDALSWLESSGGSLVP